MMENNYMIVYIVDINDFPQELFFYSYPIIDGLITVMAIYQL